jgi:hypothetical protein
MQESLIALLRDLGFVSAMVAAGGGVQPTCDTTGVKVLAQDHIYLSRSPTPTLAGAEMIREPGFWHDGPLPPGAWLHSDHLPVVAALNSPGCRLPPSLTMAEDWARCAPSVAVFLSAAPAAVREPLLRGPLPFHPM